MSSAGRCRPSTRKIARRGERRCGGRAATSSRLLREAPRRSPIPPGHRSCCHHRLSTHSRLGSHFAPVVTLVCSPARAGRPLARLPVPGRWVGGRRSAVGDCGADVMPSGSNGIPLLGHRVTTHRPRWSTRRCPLRISPCVDQGSCGRDRGAEPSSWPSVSNGTSGRRLSGSPPYRGGDMSTIRFHEATTLTPEQYVARLTDFGPGSSKDLSSCRRRLPRRARPQRDGGRRHGQYTPPGSRTPIQFGSRD